MAPRPPLRVWAVLAAGLAVLGTSAILIRWADEAPGLAVAVWRTVFAFGLVAPVGVVRARADLRRLTLRDGLLIGIAGFLLGFHFIAWIESLYHTSVASASVLVTTSPLFIAVLGFVVLRERLAVRMVIAILTAVGGAVLIGLADARGGVFPHAAWGNGLALTAALLFSVYILFVVAVVIRYIWLAWQALRGVAPEEFDPTKASSGV